jgi:hypothetical protein
LNKKIKHLFADLNPAFLYGKPFHYLQMPLLILCFAFSALAQTDSLLPAYNSTFYPSVLLSAKGIARPFLLQQQYMSLTGASIKDSTILYKGAKYTIHNYYMNPATGYYVVSSQYSAYDISGFSSIWPTQIPNILFNTSDTSFNSKSDCVGYLTRLLSATGTTSASGNAYLDIISTTHNANVSHFAAIGYVSTAYSFAVAFPTFPATISAGWQYISGNVETSLINTYNHTIQSSLGTYTGSRKGGFAQAQAGDILAFGYSASSSSNGHVMILETAPQLLNADSLKHYFPSQSIAQATTLLSTHNLYALPVFDCSGLQAHFRDSRTQTSGIGHGKLLLLTDITDDAPTGFIFDSLQVTYTSPHLDTLGTTVYAISVGRFVNAAATGIQAEKKDCPAFLLYPNPAGRMVNIAVGQLPAEPLTLTISDLLGRTLKQILIADPDFSIDISDLTEGVYTVSLISNHGRTNRKLFIIR